MFSFRHIGGLFHFRIGPLGGSFYLTSTAKRNRRALQSRMRSQIRHEKRIAQIRQHREQMRAAYAAIRYLSKAYHA